ncbi:hypothetical protein ES703_120560 [subsurface metagenome]
MEAERNQTAASYDEPQVPDYNLSSLGELLPGVLEAGTRQKRVLRESRKRLSPTNSERMNRALAELAPSTFKVHTLLWKWRGAPARGALPFFTIHSLCRFCSLTRPTVRAALRELTGKGWIERLKYSVHKKNSLYRLVPIRDVKKTGVAPEG